MTVNVPGLPDRRGRQGPSPMEGERIRPLPRRQIEDRLEDLADLYTETSGGDAHSCTRGRGLFLRRLAGDVQRPGFALLVAERAVLREIAGPGVVLTGCAYGFPVRANGPWWRGLDDYLPGELLGLAASGRLFAISGLLVQPQVRNQSPGRDWNLARRLQRRLLDDHTAELAAAGPAARPDVIGVTLADRDDNITFRALQAWGWSPVPPPSSDPASPCRALVIGP